MQTIPRGTALCTSLLVLLGALLGTTTRASGQEAGERPDAAALHRARVAGRYDMASWPRGAARIGLATDLQLAGWTAVDLAADEGRLARTFRRAETPEAEASFVLESRVADDAAGAHAVLLEWLAGLQSPARMPSVRELPVAVGDVGYFGRSGAAAGALAWVAFVRGNVAVRLCAFDARADPGLDLAGLARDVDLALLETPTLPEGAVLPRPLVRELAAQPAELPAGGRARLRVAVEDPWKGAPHLRWTVAGEGQGYVERAADGELYLYTTGPGRIELVLEVTGSTGTFARSSVAVNVLDED